MAGGRPPFEPTEKDHKTVEAMAACGMSHNDICTVLDINPKTLRKHFRETLDKAEIRANAKVVSTMFAMATSGQNPGMTAMWLKCRMHWKEPPAESRFVDEHGKDRPFLLSDADRLVAEADAELSNP